MVLIVRGVVRVGVIVGETAGDVEECAVEGGERVVTVGGGETVPEDLVE